MKEIITDPKMAGFCGLYCGACKAYLKGRCPGCHENAKARWCKVRTCCLEAEYSSCADCKEFADPKDCKKFHNFLSRTIGFVLRSDRPACIMQIRQIGLDEHARNMAENKRVTIRPG
ncbi:MAG: DUF3795 domain-containing protein [Planctomycetota bacterium]|jgi:hypothetical protein